MKHTKLYKFVQRNREAITLAFLTTVLFEILIHDYQLGATLGVIGLVLNSHIFCCLLPLGITAVFHKKECECHIHEGEIE